MNGRNTVKIQSQIKMNNCAMLHPQSKIRTHPQAMLTNCMFEECPPTEANIMQTFNNCMKIEADPPIEEKVVLQTKHCLLTATALWWYNKQYYSLI